MSALHENPRWEVFSSLVASGIPLSTAYINAGFSSTSAESSSSRLAVHPKVAARIAELRQLKATSREQTAWLNRQYVIDNLREIVERCMQVKPILNSEGQETGQFTFQPQAANRSLELLGKAAGIFIERSESVTLDIDKFSDEQLNEIIAKAEAKQTKEVVEPKGVEAKQVTEDGGAKSADPITEQLQ